MSLTDNFERIIPDIGIVGDIDFYNWKDLKIHNYQSLKHLGNVFSKFGSEFLPNYYILGKYYDNTKALGIIIDILVSKGLKFRDFDYQDLNFNYYPVAIMYYNKSVGRSVHYPAGGLCYVMDKPENYSRYFERFSDHIKIKSKDFSDFLDNCKKI